MSLWLMLPLIIFGIPATYVAGFLCVEAYQIAKYGEDVHRDGFLVAKLFFWPIWTILKPFEGLFKLGYKIVSKGLGKGESIALSVSGAMKRIGTAVGHRQALMVDNSVREEDVGS